MGNFDRNNRGLLSVLLLSVLLLSGCAHHGPALKTSSRDGDCRQLWVDVEELIHSQRLADNTAVRVKGFSYLRSSRYLEALAERAQTPAEVAFVLEEMRLLDLEKRMLELSRVPSQALAPFDQDGGDAQLPLGARLAACSRDFLAVDSQQPDFGATVRQGIELDRDYRFWLRSVGLYPLTALVVDAVAENAQEEMVARFSSPSAPAADLVSYRPPAPGAGPVPDVAALLRHSRRPPLLSLDLAADGLEALVHHFAPLLSIAGGNNGGDRFGRVVRGEEGFAVASHDPVVYYYLSQAFVQGLPVLQINYAVWFAERGAPAPWFERGHLDGLLFRVTLNWQGRPVFVDVAFHCGCYHFVLFDAELVTVKPVSGKGFHPTVGGHVPLLGRDDRLHFTISSGWHQLERIEAAPILAGQPVYELLPYQELEYFRHEDMVLSLFDHQGLVAGTNRLERFFLFPMGIPKVGAMRQRGRQPITLVGRNYFDDPHLFDKTFDYRGALPHSADLIERAADTEQERLSGRMMEVWPVTQGD